MKRDLNVNEVADALRKYLGVEFLLIEKVTVKYQGEDVRFRVGPGGALGLTVDIRRE